jgi:hypothetical protein
MPSLISAFSFRARVSSTEASSDDLGDIKQRNFCQKVLDRKRDTGKPVDFAELKRLHAAWTKDGAPTSGPRARQVHDLATRYLDWVEHQRDSAKLRAHRREAAGMLAQSIAGVTLNDTAPRGKPTLSRSISTGSTGSMGSTDSAGTSGSSSTGSAASSLSKRSAAGRFGNAMAAAVKSFRQQFTPVTPGSFKELRRAYDAFSERLETEPFDEAEALQVRRLAVVYLNRRGGAVRDGEVQRCKHEVAASYVPAIDSLIQKDRWQRQRRIDTACSHRHSPSLMERTAGRGKHAAGLVRQLSSLNRAHDGTSDRIVSQADGTSLYRFMPMPTRDAAGTTSQGPQHAVLVSALNQKLVDRIGLDLRLPGASTALLEGVPGVLIDTVDLPPIDVGAPRSASELQRALLSQWVLGRPRAGWDQIGGDSQGLLRPRHLPLSAHKPRAIAAEGLAGVSPLLFDPVTGDPIRDLHQPLAKDLAAGLLRLDIDALAKDLSIVRDVIDVANASNGAKVGLPPQHFAALKRDAVERLLEPLRALQTALTTGRDLPLAMVLVDAAEVLSHSQHD